MSNITKEAVILSEKTGAGLIDCKRALAETNGDMESYFNLRKCRLAAKKVKQYYLQCGLFDRKEGNSCRSELRN